MNHYKLRHSNFEGAEEHWFTSEQVLDALQFRALTDSLLAKASALAIQENADNWVGWDTIVRALVPLLEARGFRELRPVTVSYYGPSIIDSQNDAEQDDGTSVPQTVIDHNLGQR